MKITNTTIFSHIYRHTLPSNAIISHYGLADDWNNLVLGYCGTDNSKVTVYEPLEANLMGIQTLSVARSMHVAFTCCLLFLTHSSANTEHLTVVRQPTYSFKTLYMGRTAAVIKQ